MCDNPKYLSYFIGKVLLNRSVSIVPSHPTDGVRWDTPLGSDGTVKTIWVYSIIENLDHLIIVKNVEVQSVQFHHSKQNLSIIRPRSYHFPSI